MDDLAQARLERDINDMRIRVEKAQQTADRASHRQMTHEEVCALRYETITTQLKDIPRIFDKMEGLQKHVYIGMGLVLAVGAALKYLG